MLSTLKIVSFLPDLRNVYLSSYDQTLNYFFVLSDRWCWHGETSDSDLVFREELSTDRDIHMFNYNSTDI